MLKIIHQDDNVDHEQQLYILQYYQGSFGWSRAQNKSLDAIIGGCHDQGCCGVMKKS